MVLNQVIPDGLGYGYGYLGTGDLGGTIDFTITYTPPSIAGDYKARVSVTTPTQSIASTPTNFSVLSGLTTTALSTLYPASGTEALGGDVVILQVDVSAKAKDIAVVNDIPKATVSGDLVTGTVSMIAASQFHSSLRAKWGVSSAADLLMPLKLNTNAGEFHPSIKVEDIAGQTAELKGTDSSAATIKVVSSRTTFNVFLMPGFNFISPPLQCTSPAPTSLCSGDEFSIAQLLDQKVSNVSSAFLSAISKTADSVRLSDVVAAVFAYNSTSKSFDGFSSDGITSNDSLSNMGVGRGFIVTTATTGGGTIDPFTRNTESTNTQFPNTGVPVPLKLTFTGKVVADPGATPPRTAVTSPWNLVGPHTEKDTAVNVFLRSVTVPERTWETLLAFKNELDISLDQAGKLKLLAGGKPEIILVTRFETLLSPEFGGPSPSGDLVPAGSGLWLLMCETPASRCVDKLLAPVLE